MAVVSYYIIENLWEDKNYDFYFYDICIYGNIYECKCVMLDFSKDFGKMVNYLFFGKLQDIFYDGIVDDICSGFNLMNFCIDQLGVDLWFVNVDVVNDFEEV